jgi:hypothetical protein
MDVSMAAGAHGLASLRSRKPSKSFDEMSVN